MLSIRRAFMLLNFILHSSNLAYAIIGYHCEPDPTNIVTIPLNVEDCGISKITPQISETYLQVLRITRNEDKNKDTLRELIFTDDCYLNQYDLAYEGMGKKFSDINSTLPTVFAVTIDHVTFPLLSTGRQNVCGNIIHTTEHPELFIFETEDGSSFAHHCEKKTTNDANLFIYVNKKLIKLNLHLENIKEQIQLLYHDVLLHRCYTKQNYIQNALRFATATPDMLGYVLMGRRGYTALLRGELAHIIKCVPIEVTIRKTTNCYNDLPVSHDENDLFLSPFTHVLKENGTQIKCDPMMPPMFFINNRWYTVLPSPKDASELIGFIWSTVNKTVYLTYKKVWKLFQELGAYSCGILGIIIILRVLKLLINLIIRNFCALRKKKAVPNAQEIRQGSKQE